MPNQYNDLKHSDLMMLINAVAHLEQVAQDTPMYQCVVRMTSYANNGDQTTVYHLLKCAVTYC